MPKSRPPREVWEAIRREVWGRDGGRCTHCGGSMDLEDAHIDHIRSGKGAGNGKGNLRVLCRRCHVLRDEPRHAGMISSALRDGIIPPDWRARVWRG